MIEAGMVLMMAETFGIKLTISANNAGVFAVSRVGRAAQEACHCGSQSVADQCAVKARILDQVLSHCS